MTDSIAPFLVTGPQPPNLRVPLPNNGLWNSRESDLQYRLLTADVIDKPPPHEHVKKGKDYFTVRLGGRTIEGYTAVTWLTGFNPYFMLRVPSNFNPYDACDMDDLEEWLFSKRPSLHKNLVRMVPMQRRTTFGFTDAKLFQFLRMEFRGTRSMHTCGNLFMRGPVQLDKDGDTYSFEVCELKRIPPILKFLHDKTVDPSAWVRFPRATYEVFPGESRYQINVHADIKHIVPFSCDDYVPFVEWSWDMETTTAKHTFPNANRPFDPVVQIAAELRHSSTDKVLHKVLYCLGPMDPIEDVEVRRYSSEAAMILDAFREMREVYDPDIITGYNIVQYDIPYIMTRARMLPAKYQQMFFDMGRFPGELTQLEVKETDDADDADDDEEPEEGLKQRVEYHVQKLPGRRVEDVYREVKVDHKLSSYRLEDVGQHFLKEGKHPVEYEDIFAAYQDIADRSVAQHHLGRFKRVLTEIRLMSAVFLAISELAPESLSRSTVTAYVVNKFPESHAQSAREKFTPLLNFMCPLPKEDNNATKTPTKGDDKLTCEQCLDGLKRYVQVRTRGQTLVYEGAMLDLEHQEDADETADAPGKRRQSGDVFDTNDFAAIFRHIETRLVEECAVLQRVLDQRVTIAFARTHGEHDEKGAEAHRAHLLSEKTRIGRYCVMDAILPAKLRYKLQSFIKLMEMARVTGVTPTLLTQRGQTIKVVNMILMWCRKNGYVMNKREMELVEFIGGCVLVPEKGLYEKEVVTLDFASLYPSIIRTFLLCYLSLLMQIYPDVPLQQLVRRPDLEVLEINIGEPSNQSYFWVQKQLNPETGKMEKVRTMLPEILEGLINARNAVKAELKTETDPFRKSVLNGRQLALKVSANSVYGFTGFKHSQWQCLPIAVCTTVQGRNLIAQTKQMVESKYRARVIYGDSVTGDTPCLVRDTNTGNVAIRTIADLVENPHWSVRGEKQVISAADLDCLRIWTESGWTRIRHVIRHKTEKRIWRVSTHTGIVDVTEDHSLLDSMGQMVHVSKCKVGVEELLCGYPANFHCSTDGNLDRPKSVSEAMAWGQFMAVPTGVLNSSRPIRQAFWEGYYHKWGKKATNGDIQCNVKGKLGAARLFYLTRSLGYETTLDTSADTPELYQLTCTMNKQRKPQGVITGLWDVTQHYADTYVYDLETENHHFQAGVGQLIVHNTDSVMCIFPTPPRLMRASPQERMLYVFDMAKKAAKEVTAEFTKMFGGGAIDLEFEKVYYPYYLQSKKRYAGIMYTKPEAPDKIDTKGIEAIRRDNCPIMRDTVTEVIRIVLEELNIPKAVNHAVSQFKRLAEQAVPLEELIITKRIKEGRYKDEKHIHVHLNRRLERENPMLAADPGDRIPYVVVKLPNEDKRTKNYVKGEHPVLVEKRGMEPDWKYYAFNQLKGALDRFFCIINNWEYIKGKGAMRQQATDYLWDEWLKQLRQNDAIQVARVSGHREIGSYFAPSGNGGMKRAKATKQ